MTTQPTPARMIATNAEQANYYDVFFKMQKEFARYNWRLDIDDEMAW